MLRALKKSATLLLLAGMLPYGPIQAQSINTEAEGIRVFEPDYYAEFDPVNALDLVERTPGFDLQEQTGGRGLSGVRSNILINGKRPPPKGQSIWQQLSNVPYTSVTQIVLIDSGATLDIDMQGYNQVVDVILEDERAGYYELETEYSHSGSGDVDERNQRQLDIGATGSFSWRGHEFTVRAGADDNSNRSPAEFIDIDPADPQLRLGNRSEFARDQKSLELSTIFNLGNNSTLSVNADLYDESRSLDPLAEFDSLDESGTVDRTFMNGNDGRELSAEYLKPLGERTELMLALVDSRNEDFSRSSFAAGGDSLSSLRDRESGETAARLRLTHKLTDSLTLRPTLSSAYNYFEGNFQILENGVNVPLAGSDSRVEEDRHTLTLGADWNWRADWALRGELSAGAYEIETQDDFSDRQTEYQGRVAVDYKPWDRTTITYESRYEIGQLGLSQFLASSNLSSEILQAGASGLESERQWVHSLDYDQRFGDRGVLRFGVSQRKVQNPIRTVALSDELIISQNTSPEKINRFNVNIEYPFTRFDLENLVLNTGFTIADSETVDPVTGETRDVPWASPLEWSLGMRLNPGEGRWAGGFNIWKRIDNDNYAVREIREEVRDSEWRAFIEWEFIDGVKLRGRIEGPRYDRQVARYFSAIRRTGLDPSFLAITTSRRDSSASFELEWRRTPNLEVTATINPQPYFRSQQSLLAFGAASGPALEREIAQGPSAQIEFRLFTQ